MSETEHQTQAAWYAAAFGDYHFEIKGTTTERLRLIPASDGEIGVCLPDSVNASATCWLRPTEARELAAELLRLAELV